MLFVGATEVATGLSGVVGLRKVAWWGKTALAPVFSGFLGNIEGICNVLFRHHCERA